MFVSFPNTQWSNLVHAQLCKYGCQCELYMLIVGLVIALHVDVFALVILLD